MEIKLDQSQRDVDAVAAVYHQDIVMLYKVHSSDQHCTLLQTEMMMCEFC